MKRGTSREAAAMGSCLSSICMHIDVKCENIYKVFNEMMSYIELVHSSVYV